MKAVYAAMFSLLAGEAGALSCLRPDGVSSFQRADEQSETIYLLRGVLSFDERLLPETDMLNQEQAPDPISARFEGHALGADGFTVPYARELTLQPLCAGPWCGGAQSDEDALIFATVAGDDLIVEANPCGGTIFYNVTEEMVRQVTSCMAGDCSAQPLQ